MAPEDMYDKKETAPANPPAKEASPAAPAAEPKAESTPATPPAPKTEPVTPNAPKETPPDEAPPAPSPTDMPPDSSTPPVNAEVVPETEAEKPKETPAEKPAPEQTEIDYSGIKLGENYRASEEDLKEVISMAKANKLSTEQASAMLESRDKALKRQMSQLKAKHEEAVAGWKESIKSDPNLGGENSEKAMLQISQGEKAFVPKELMDFLESSGYRHNPSYMQMMHKLGSMVDSDSIKKPGGTVPTNATNKSDAEKWYGQTTPKSLS